ncbi:MAG: cytochrome [Acidimicrobiales bacterium]|nr:cytochrome [Acidimicrobiales bacterium]
MSNFELPAMPDPEALAHPQPLLKMLRDVGPVVPLEDMGMLIVGGHDDVREVLANPGIFSSGVEAVSIGQVRPLVPLQIDPPEHKNYRKLLDPIFAPRRMALLEDQTRDLVRGLVEPFAATGSGNFHDAISVPIPTTVFLQLLGLPVSRRDEFLALKDGIIRPPTRDPEKRKAMADATGQKIYAALQEAIDERHAEPRDDIISNFLTAEVDGHRLSDEDVLDICYLFFLAGLDTVTASLDCMISFLAQNPEHRQQIVDDPAVIPHAIEEMLRWETPVPGIIRITTQDTEISGCPIEAGRTVVVMIASANTDERAWEDADTVDFQRPANKHIAFGGGAHRCLGSHLARLELRIVLEEWHRAVPSYAIPEGHELLYSQDLRSVENLELVW